MCPTRRQRRRRLSYLGVRGEGRGHSSSSYARVAGDKTNPGKTKYIPFAPPRMRRVAGDKSNPAETKQTTVVPGSSGAGEGKATTDESGANTPGGEMKEKTTNDSSSSENKEKDGPQMSTKAKETKLVADQSEDIVELAEPDREGAQAVSSVQAEHN
ncbi:hypothetical protein NMY22_g13399 [Coprinellus aureogranulatus]|nr:hypothetical protein NMY22_g13399 [Coprinellus aureogranulatus]